MELETQLSNPCSYNVYETAPTSPNAYSRSNSMEFYYSAPASPRRKPLHIVTSNENQHTSSNFDDFEFETSKKFSGQLNVLTEQDFESRDDQSHDVKPMCRARGDSLPAMAFADELFLNGLVMPLKLPPRLQCDSDSNNQKCPVLSPKSPRTVCRLPFARKSSWNNDVDPFLVAMEKVREEKKGRNSHHRRSRSYSPFRAIPNNNSNRHNIGSCNQDENSPIETMQVPNSSHSGPLDFKGSAYARWVRDQTREGMLSQRRTKSPRGFLFGQRVRPVKTDHHEVSDKPGSINEGKCVEDKKCANVKEESKVQKLKGLLLRYASFGRGENNGNKQQVKTGEEVCKAGYFSRLSVKFKAGKGTESNVKNGNDGAIKTVVVRHKPPVVFCLGYGGGTWKPCLSDMII